MRLLKTEKPAAAAAAAAVPVPVDPAVLKRLAALQSVCCVVCGGADDDENMLLCDGCDDGYHLRCAR